jgi:adenylylsulfate kinase
MSSGGTRIAPCVIWFTGLSGAGKSTIAQALYEELLRRGVAAEYLDGEVIRALFPGMGFSRAERDLHVKRVGFLASRLEHHGITTICALISPYGEARAEVRQRCQRLFEIYISTPLAECERRDPKGLYACVRRHEILHFTGVDDPYEPPKAPDLEIDTTTVPVAESVARLLALFAGERKSPAIALP